MASLGDSFTKGFGANGTAADNPSESWATGTDVAVNSHYLRLLSQNPAISGNNSNDSLDGSNMAAVVSQADVAVGQAAPYVTVLAGTNDVCTPTAAGMTTVSSFSTSLNLVLTKLGATPGVKVFVASIPDWFGFWQKFHSNVTAQNAWAAFPNRCPVLLGSAATPSDRTAFAQRVTDLNAAIVSVCAGFAFCSTDGGAVFRQWGTFAAGDFTFDFFHPSVSGQAKIATTTWSAGPWVGPTNSSLPTISGNASQGNTLTATTGTWNGAVATYGYQWKRCDSDGNGCKSISAATSPTYVVQAADAASTLRVLVTASDASGAFGTASSAPSATVAPIGSGTAAIGRAIVGSLSASGTGNYLDTSGPYHLGVSATGTLMRAYLTGGPASMDLRLVGLRRRRRRQPRSVRRRHESGDDRDRCGGRLGRLPVCIGAVAPAGQLLARVLVQPLGRSI